MANFLMPALGADMETAKVVQWNVRPGDRVKRGDVVAVVETHKGAIDVECFLDGVIDHLAPLGELLPVGAVIAQVVGEDETSPSTSDLIPSTPRVALTKPTTAPIVATQVRTTDSTVRAKVSPAARQMAQRLGLSCEGLIGTGGDGAVVLADIERAASTATAPAKPTSTGKFDPSQMRLAIATAMGRSKREIPHYYLSSTLDFTVAQDWLSVWNEPREPADRLLPAVLLLKATALALKKVTALNGFYTDNAFHPAPAVHVGWAVALRGGGLIAPALHDVDQKPLPQLMAEMRDLVQRARAGGLRSSEISDPTVTVTNLGERGAESGFGVIYPPQVALIGFGRISQRPWAVDGVVQPRLLVNASLAADHRVSDGHQGGLLLSAIDQALQSPDTL